MKRLTKTLLVSLALAMLLCAAAALLPRAPLTDALVPRAHAATVVAEGDLKKNGHYKVYDDGLLVVTGNGEISDEYSYEHDVYDEYGHDETVTDIWFWRTLAKLGKSGVFFDRVEIREGVTKIGWSVFIDCSTIVSVSIPDSVTDIAEDAFNYCTSLQTVEIGTGLQDVDWHAFENCTALQGVYIKDLTRWCEVRFSLPSSNPLSNGARLYVNGAEVTDLTIPSGITEVENFAFSGCSSLTSVTLPDSVTKIGSRAFQGCSGLTSVKLSKNLTATGYHTFEDCTDLRSVVIPNGIRCIQETVFSGCTNLVSVVIPKSVTTIQEDAFLNCWSLNWVLYLGTQQEWDEVNGTDELSGHSIYFKNRSGLVGPNVSYMLDENHSLFLFGSGNMSNYAPSTVPWSVWKDDIWYLTVLPGVERIGENTFNGCTKLEQIRLYDGVKRIESNAFTGCTALAYVTLGSGMEEIGENAFYQCAALHQVTIADLADWFDIRFRNAYANPLNYAQYLRVNDYENTVTELNTLGVMGVTEIKSYAFCGYRLLRSVSIPGSLTKIGSGAFHNCAQLTDVYYAGSMLQWNKVSVGVSNESLQSAAMHFSVPGGTCGAEGDGSSVLWEFAGGVLTVGGSGAMGKTTANWPWYEYRDQINSVVIEDGVTSVGDFAFYSCANLSQVTLGKDVTHLGDRAFYNCPALQELTLPDGLISFGANVLPAGCTVRAMVGSAGQALAENEGCAFRPTGVPVPKNVTAEATAEKEITVKWKLVPGATQYNIFRYNSKKKQYVYKDTTFNYDEKPDQYRDEDVCGGVTYYYKVVAVYKANGITEVSDMSPAVNATAFATPDAPSRMTVRASGGKQLTVSWSKVTGATQYNVYRYKGADKQYHYIGTTFATAAKPTEYADTGLNAGTSYYYKVVAVIKDGNGTVVSPMSAAANAKAR